MQRYMEASGVVHDVLQTVRFRGPAPSDGSQHAGHVGEIFVAQAVSKLLRARAAHIPLDVREDDDKFIPADAKDRILLRVEDAIDSIPHHLNQRVSGQMAVLSLVAFRPLTSTKITPTRARAETA